MTPNKIGRANRRPAFPFNAGQQFEKQGLPLFRRTDKVQLDRFIVNPLLFVKLDLWIVADERAEAHL